MNTWILYAMFWGALAIISFIIQLDILLLLLWFFTGDFLREKNFIGTVSLTAKIYRAVESKIKIENNLARVITTLLAILIIAGILAGLGAIIIVWLANQGGNQ